VVELILVYNIRLRGDHTCGITVSPLLIHLSGGTKLYWLVYSSGLVRSRCIRDWHIVCRLVDCS